MDTLCLIVILTLNSIYDVLSLSTPKAVSCCKNGGVCILGSFCKCPEFFIGRYCQYHMEYNACRHVPHGYWIRSDCDKCRCFNGRIFCIPKYYFGCDDDDEPLDSTRTVDPFRGKTITLFSKDPDVHHSLIPDTDVAPSAAENYDDEYYYSDNMAASAARAVFPLFIYALMLPLVIL
ncbi:teratocarcinoma-derived growth factor [Magallana gigas]|uniref:teratocarcinoma-derived growth factor n=1 Tax=Magallana gigas TaxID=29159 RepID=UPI0033406649